MSVNVTDLNVYIWERDRGCWVFAGEFIVGCMLFRCINSSNFSLRQNKRFKYFIRWSELLTKPSPTSILETPLFGGPLAWSQGCPLNSGSFVSLLLYIARFQVVFPVTEQIMINDNVQPVPKSFTRELGTRKSLLENSDQNENGKIKMNLSPGVVSCGSLFRSLCRWAVGGSLWLSFLWKSLALDNNNDNNNNNSNNSKNNDSNKSNAQVPKSVIREKYEKSVFCLLVIFFTQVLSLFSITTVFRDLFSSTSTFVSSENLCRIWSPTRKI